MTWWFWTSVVALWVGIGLVTVLLLIRRRGHLDPMWFLLGAVLGPLFAPVALERATRHSTAVEHRVEAGAGAGARVPGLGRPGSRPESVEAAPRSGPSVLVAVDGSAASDQAVRVTGRLVAAGAGRIVLATVLDVDRVERGDAQAQDDARHLLHDRAGWLSGGPARIETHIAAGAAGQALLDLAQAEQVDVIVIGRHRSALPHTALGGVTEQVASSAPCAVLLAGPAGEPE